MLESLTVLPQCLETCGNATVSRLLQALCSRGPFTSLSSWLLWPLCSPSIFHAGVQYVCPTAEPRSLVLAWSQQANWVEVIKNKAYLHTFSSVFSLFLLCVMVVATCIQPLLQRSIPALMPQKSRQNEIK